MEPKSASQKKVGIIAGVVVVLAVVVVTVFSGRKSAEVTQTQNVPEQNPVGTSLPPVDTAKKSVPLYKDGTYTATGTYMSPGGQDQIGVTITLKDDVVTAVSIDPRPGDDTSERYMNKFASGYQQYVIGKNIADIQLTKVSGSSLTPIGFNDALAQIKAKARA